MKEKKLNTLSEYCVCNDMHGLFIPNRRLSGVLAGVIISLFFAFVVGFFAGQRHIISNFSEKTSQDSFGDQVYASLCALTDMPETEGNESSDEESNKDENNVDEEELLDKNMQRSTDRSEIEESNPSYYAQLIGFSSLKSAQRCEQRLLNRGFSVEIKKRQSKTARGKAVAWYQLVTQAYENKEELQNIVDRITQQEKLKDVYITTAS
jgi:hypothetical protein